MTTVVISAPVSNRPTYISARAGRSLFWKIKKEYPEVELWWLPASHSTNQYVSVLQKLSAKDTVLFIYLGHGKRRAICGKIPPGCGGSGGGMIDPDNVDVLSNMITFAVACWTACGLGRLAEETGALNYVGFRKSVYVAFDMDEHDYTSDIIDVWHTFPLRLLAGDSSAKAIAAMSKKSIGYEKYYTRHKDDLLYAEYYARRFKSNRTALVPYGNQRARLI